MRRRRLERLSDPRPSNTPSEPHATQTVCCVCGSELKNGRRFRQHTSASTPNSRSMKTTSFARISVALRSKQRETHRRYQLPSRILPQCNTLPNKNESMPSRSSNVYLPASINSSSCNNSGNSSFTSNSCTSSKYSPTRFSSTSTWHSTPA